MNFELLQICYQFVKDRLKIKKLVNYYFKMKYYCTLILKTKSANGSATQLFF